MGIPGTVLIQKRSDVRHIVVAKGKTLGARQPCSGPEAGMGELVDQDKVVTADQRGRDAAVGEIPGAEYAGRLGALKPCEPGFQLAGRLLRVDLDALPREYVAGVE